MLNNPFESGHIKNYLLLYASIIVIMILFFIASTLFHDVQNVEEKIFNTEINTSKIEKDSVEENASTTKFKLMKTGY